MRVRAVAEVGPCRSFGAMLADLPQHGFPADPIEGVGKVNLQRPLVVAGNVVIEEEGFCGVYDGLRSSSYANSKLERGEVGGRFTRCLFGHALGRPTPDRLPNGNRTMSAVFFDSG